MALTIGTATIVRMDANLSWGVHPSAATLVVVTQGTLALGQSVAFVYGAFTFAGLITNIVSRKTVAAGEQFTVELTDNRLRLDDGSVFAIYNVANDEAGAHPDRAAPDLQWTSYNPGGGSGGLSDSGSPSLNENGAPTLSAGLSAKANKRQWKHMLTRDFVKQVWTYTSAPLSASSILNDAFAGSTLQFSFGRSYHSAQSKPVFGVDASGGRKMSEFVRQMSSAQGLNVYLDNGNTLVWGRLGSGALPAFATGPDIYRESLSVGTTLSNAETGVTIVGDRNRLQMLEVVLEADWAAGWQAYLSALAWNAVIATEYGPFTADRAGEALKAAVARKITVRQFAAKVGNTALLDSGRWGDMARNDMPAWLYIQEFVFRSYRIPRDYTVDGTPVAECELVDLIRDVGVESDNEGTAVTLSWEDTYYPGSFAFVVAQGQPLDLLDGRTIDHFISGDIDPGNQWTVVNQFQVDAVAKTLHFSTPIFRPGSGANGLYAAPNASIEELGDEYSMIRVPNDPAQVTLNAANVKASLCFATGKYVKNFGTGPRFGHRVVGTLAKHEIDDGSARAEVPYEDGQTADQAAADEADGVLGASKYVASGSAKRAGFAGTGLSTAISAVDISISHEAGVGEEVHWARERRSNQLSRVGAERLASVRDLPDQIRENEKEIERLRAIAMLSRRAAAAAASESKRKRLTTVASVFETVVGCSDGAVAEYATAEATDQRLAGEVIFLDGTGTESAAGNRFGGIQLMNATGRCVVAQQGIVPVRVTGEVSPGDRLGVDTGQRVAKVGGSRFVGTVNHHTASGYSGGEYLCLCRVGAGDSAEAGDHPWRVSIPGEDQNAVVMTPGTFWGLESSTGYNFATSGDSGSFFLKAAVDDTDPFAGIVNSFEIVYEPSRPADGGGFKYFGPLATLVYTMGVPAIYQYWYHVQVGYRCGTTGGVYLHWGV